MYYITELNPSSRKKYKNDIFIPNEYDDYMYNNIAVELNDKKDQCYLAIIMSFYAYYNSRESENLIF